jgi:hypothetical protein
MRVGVLLGLLLSVAIVQCQTGQLECSTAATPIALASNTWAYGSVGSGQCYDVSFTGDINSVVLQVSIKPASNSTLNTNICATLQNGASSVFTVCETSTNANSYCIGGVGNTVVYSSSDYFLNVWCNTASCSETYEVYWNSYSGSMTDNAASCPNAPAGESSEYSSDEDGGNLWLTLLLVFGIIGVVVAVAVGVAFYVSTHKVQTMQWVFQLRQQWNNLVNDN